MLITKAKGIIYNHLLSHDAIYDSDCYDSREDGVVRSSEVISDSIIRDLKPQRVVDVGCGSGSLLVALKEKGCYVLGLEYSKVALDRCRSRQVNVIKFDLEKDIFQDDRTFDVVTSMEVAEHLPENIADRYLDLLTLLGSTIVFTAAKPGQGGVNHVNEQPPVYWISKIRDRGFVIDDELSKRWRDSWRDSRVVNSWYYKNLMVFRRLP